MNKINVSSKTTDKRAVFLSNTPSISFMLDDKILASVQGFIQGIKFPMAHPKREIAFHSAGKFALSLGVDAERRYVWWEGRELLYGSTAHHKLIERAIRAKFDQNEKAMNALIATAGMQIIHETDEPESPTTSLPAAVFCDILTRIREGALRAETATSWLHTTTAG